MKLEIKEIDGVPVTGISDGSRTEIKSHFSIGIEKGYNIN